MAAPSQPLEQNSILTIILERQGESIDHSEVQQLPGTTEQKSKLPSGHKEADCTPEWIRCNSFKERVGEVSVMKKHLP